MSPRIVLAISMCALVIFGVNLVFAVRVVHSDNKVAFLVLQAFLMGCTFGAALATVSVFYIAPTDDETRFILKKSVECVSVRMNDLLDSFTTMFCKLKEFIGRKNAQETHHASPGTKKAVRYPKRHSLHRRLEQNQDYGALYTQRNSGLHYEGRIRARARRLAHKLTYDSHACTIRDEKS